MPEQRLSVLRSTGLLDSPPEEAFDRFTRLAARILEAPVSLLSLVDADRQFFKSAVGLAEPWASRRETPLSHSFCQHAVSARAPLVVPDAREHPVLHDNPAVSDLGVIAYCGVPLEVRGQVIGVLCVIDHQPRRWSADAVEPLRDLAALVVAEIELRDRAREIDAQRALMEAMLEDIGDAVIAVDRQGTCLVVNEVARAAFPTVRPGEHLSAGLGLRWYTAEGVPVDVAQSALARGLRGEHTRRTKFVRGSAVADVRWFEVSGGPVRGVDHHTAGAIAVFRDVTESKLRTDLYVALAQNIPRSAVVLFDPELRCVAVDGALVGDVERSALRGRSLRELAGAGATDPAFRRLEETLGRTLGGESLVVDHEHAGHTFALHTAPIRDALGQVTFGIVLAIDVTAERRTGLALRRSEEIHRVVLENLPEGAAVLVDREMRYLSAAGPALPRLLKSAGAEEGETILGRTVSEVVKGPLRDEVIGICRATLDGASLRRETHRGELSFALNTSPIRDAEGVVVAALLFSHDVTERNRVLSELERERERFRSLVRNVPVGVFETDAAGKCTFVNARWMELSGLDSVDALGDGWVRAIHPDDRARVFEEWSAATAERRPFELDYRFRSATGKVSWVAGRSVALTAGDGVIEGYLGTVLDVTDRTEAAHRLAQSERSFRVLVEQAPFGVVVVREMRIVYANTTILAILQRVESDLVGRDAVDALAHPDDRDALRGRIDAIAGGVDLTPVPIRCRRSDGGDVFLEAKTVRLEFDGAPSLVATLVDVSERVRIEGERASNHALVRRSLEEKETLLKEIHHRVKNNLQVVSSIISLHANRLDAPAARGAFEEVRGRVHAIALLHERIYRSNDLRRIAMEGYVQGLVEDIVRVTGGRAQVSATAPGVYFDLDAAVPTGLLVNELVTNALKHAFPEAREGRVDVTIAPCPAGFEVAVTDDGVGFPPGFSIDRTKSLGLVLARSLARQLGGPLVLGRAGGVTRCAVAFSLSEVVSD